MAEDSTHAVQWFRERLEQLARLYPELTTARAQRRLEAELRRQADEEDTHGPDSNQEA
jgi:hypothetical protein